MRILSVEPDAATAQDIAILLKAATFLPSHTDTGEEAVELGKLYEYDAILLEMQLPDMFGAQVIRSLRGAAIKTPIIVLSTVDSVNDKVRALSLGADDYMTKPFHNDELIARIRAVVRRYKGHAGSVIKTGELTVDIENRTAQVRGEAVHLTGKEYKLLELLAMRKGATLTKERIMNYLYDDADEPCMKIIDVFVCKLRKKLRAFGCDYIETVWGRGFVLQDPSVPVVTAPNLAPEIRDMIAGSPHRSDKPWAPSIVPSLRDLI